MIQLRFMKALISIYLLALFPLQGWVATLPGDGKQATSKQDIKVIQQGIYYTGFQDIKYMFFL